MDVEPSQSERELIKKSILEIRNLKKELSSLKTQKMEPIAIIGMSCSFPGKISTPEEFWKFLTEQNDGITDPIESRWNITNIAGIDYREAFYRGGFISHDIFEFDPLFFGIPVKEANYLDPQHRLFLENAWKALINAGIDAKSLNNSNTGVFCGITSNEYLHLLLSEIAPENLNAYITTGNCLNFIVGRLSYILGLQGPAIAVDTACSSSLVAVQMAVQALRNRQCNMAIAGGVNLMLTPQTSLLLKNANMLSLDGRCKTFSEDADGYGRGEGCGIVILKRLTDAINDGDRIYASIKNIVVKHDGKKSGLTVPTSLSQKMLLQETLLDTHVTPHDISYCEAHGTGTSLGDPIELEALNDIYGKGRASDDPVHISSVKSNFGHLEAAAGIAGLIKATLAIYHKKIPPHFSVNQLNSHFNWKNSHLNVVKENIDWPKNKNRLATVSAFGASGINAHAILEDVESVVSVDIQHKLATLTLPKFNKTFCWYKQFDKNSANANKPIRKKLMDELEAAIYLISLNIDCVPTIRQHQIFGTIVLTGSIYLEIALGITKELLGNAIQDHFSFGNVTLLRPIIFKNETVDLRVIFEKIDILNRKKIYRIKIFPQSVVNDDEKLMHASIDIELLDRNQQPKIGKDYIEKIIDMSQEVLDGKDFYNHFWQKTFKIGETFHLFDKIWRIDGANAIGLCRPKSFIAKTNGYGLDHNSIIAYLCGLLFKGAIPRNQMMQLESQGKAFIGIGYDYCHFYSSLVKDELYAVATITDSQEDIYNGDVHIIDVEGNIVCEMSKISFRSVDRDSIPQKLEVNNKTNFNLENWQHHPILGNKYSKINEWKFSSELEYDSYPIIGDHLTFDYSLFPAVGYINLAIKAIKKIFSDYQFTKIENLKIAQPIMLRKGDKYKIRTQIDKISPHDFVYHVQAYSAKRNVINHEWGLSSNANITDLPQLADPTEKFDSKIVETYHTKYNTKEFFDTFWNDDFILGRSYQFMEMIWRKEGEAIGIIRKFENYQKRIGIDDLTGNFLQIYMSLPLALAAIPDAAIQKAKNNEATCIAVSVKAFITYDNNAGELYEELWSHAVLADNESLDDKWITNFSYFDKNGKLVAKVDGVEFHLMDKKSLELLKSSMEEVEVDYTNSSVDVMDFLRNELHDILGVSVDTLQQDIHLGELMDSIMALQLRVKIEKGLAILLPLNIIVESMNVNDLATEIIKRSNGLLN